MSFTCGVLREWIHPDLPEEVERMPFGPKEPAAEVATEVARNPVLFGAVVGVTLAYIAMIGRKLVRR